MEQNKFIGKRTRLRRKFCFTRFANLSLVNEQRFSNDALRLSDHFNRPGIIEECDNMDDLTRGMSYQPEKASDQFFDAEVHETFKRISIKISQTFQLPHISDHGILIQKWQTTGIWPSRDRYSKGSRSRPRVVQQLPRILRSTQSEILYWLHRLYFSLGRYIFSKEKIQNCQ